MNQCAVLTHADGSEAPTILSWVSQVAFNGKLSNLASRNIWLCDGAARQRSYFVLDTGATESHSIPFRQRMERARSELERLQDGWAGPHSKAPSDQTLADVDRVLEAITSAKAVPEVEVDEDSGHVTFRWQKPDVSTALSFVLRGRRQVTMVVTELGDSPRASSQQFPVEKDGAIVRFLNRDEKLMDLLGYA